MKLCVIHQCPVTESFPTKKEIYLSTPGCSFAYFSRVQEIPETYWELAAVSGDYFLRKNYLAHLEACPPDGMEFGYILFRQHGRSIGIAYFQLLDFRAGEHLRSANMAPRDLKNLLAAHLNFRILVCGNMLLTGQHAYFFATEDEQLTGQLLREALRKIALNTRREGGKLDAVMLKDVQQDQQEVLRNWRQADYQIFGFQPNMVLTIPDFWHDMDDYLDALTSKYRVRYRRARKKLAGIHCCEFGLSQIRSFEKELYALYKNVADSSDFCMTYLHPNYFSGMKARTPEDFQLWAYFKGERIIGFCTAVKNGRQMEAHFLGLDQSENTDSQLYLNMLYHLIETAIAGKARQLIFSRTALAIKSSVGAVAEPTAILLNYPFSPVLQCLTPYLIRLLEPKEDWEPRHPFRDHLPEEILDR